MSVVSYCTVFNYIECRTVGEDVQVAMRQRVACVIAICSRVVCCVVQACAYSAQGNYFSPIHFSERVFTEDIHRSSLPGSVRQGDM